MLIIFKRFINRTGIKKLMRKYSIRYNKFLLEKDVRFFGQHLSLGKFVDVSYPEFCILGKNVRIGNNVSIKNRAGIVICDNAVIENDAHIVVADEESHKPIFIKKHKGGESPSNLSANTLSSTRDSSKSLQKVTGEELGENFIFIVGTGRSGSTTIARTLNLHPQIHCRHEPNTLLLQLANDYVHKRSSRKEIREALRCIYTQCSIYPIPIYGESDQKLSFIIDMLSEILPKSKFIWLIRNARDFAYSACAHQNWYKSLPIDKTIDFPLIRAWSKARIMGDLTGAIAQKDWADMSPIEKCCWYWTFCNAKIEEELVKIDRERWIQVKIEDFAEDITRILDFVGSQTDIPLPVKKHNKGNTSTVQSIQGFEEALKKWCAKDMQKWYGFGVEGSE